MSLHCGPLRGPQLLVWCSVNNMKNIRLCLTVGEKNETRLATEPRTVVVSPISPHFPPNAFQHLGV